MIIGDVEIALVDHDDHMDMLVTRGLDTIIVPMTPKEIADLIGEIAIKFGDINRRIRSGA